MNALIAPFATLVVTMRVTSARHGLSAVTKFNGPSRNVLIPIRNWNSTRALLRRENSRLRGLQIQHSP